MSSLYEIVNDTSRFLKLPSDPAFGREEKLQKFLRTLNKKGFSSQEQYEKYILVVHGNPKMHKLRSESDKLTFPPIVSFIGA